MLQSVTECYTVLQSVTECYRVLEGYRVFQSITGYYKVLQSITKTNLAHLLGPLFGLFFLISKMSLKHRTPYSCNRAFLRTCPQDYWTGWTVGRLGKAGFPGVGRCENARSAGAGIGQSPQPIPDRPASNLKAVTFSILPPGQAPG